MLIVLLNLIRVREPTHARHNTEDIVIDGVDTDFGGVDTLDSRVREDKLEGGVVNAREIAGARWLVLFWAKGERVDIDTGVRGTGMVLEGLDKVEVCTFALREAVLTIKL